MLFFLIGTSISRAFAAFCLIGRFLDVIFFDMISIVTITYNNFEELVDTLNSTEKVPAENVIINGGTCERTRKYLVDREYVHISEPDEGISDAFNKGLSRASGSAIMFLNSGDLLVSTDFLSQAERLLVDYDFVYSDVIFGDPVAGNLIMKADNSKNLGSGMPFCHQALIVRREIFDRIGGFEKSQRYAMCFDFVCRLRKINARGFYVPVAAVKVDGSGVSSKQESRVLAESLASLKKHGFWGFSEKISFGRRKAFFVLRTLMTRFGFEKLLVFLKRLKYQLS